MTGRAAPALLALGAAGAYGMNIVFVRLLATFDISGASVVFYRVLVLLVLVSALVLAWRRSVRVAPGEGASVLVLGLASTAVGICYLSSVAYIPVTVAVAIFYTFPVLIVLASPFVEGERLNAALIAIALCAFVGVVCVVGPAADILDWRGIAFAVAASVATAIQFFAAARARRTSLIAKVFWINAMVLPATALIGLAFGMLNPPGDLTRAPVAMVLGVGIFVVGFVLQIAALARGSAVVIGLAFCAEPVVAALGSAAILGERPSAVQILGGGLVLLAIAANVLRDARRRPVPAAAAAP